MVKREPDYCAAELRSEEEVERDREHREREARTALRRRADGDQTTAFLEFLVEHGLRRGCDE